MTTVAPTQISRYFDPATRKLTPTKSTYAGQVGDTYSTQLNFEYPVGWLTGRTAYIAFNVKDSAGNYYFFGPDSTPKFSGITFQIPWAVTSKIANKRLEYQLTFIEQSADPDSASATMSIVDTIVFAEQSILDPVKILESIGSDLVESDPTLRAWINYFRDNAMVIPATYDQGQTLTFTTKSGATSVVKLNMPYLDADGHIIKTFIDPIYQLYANLVTAWEAVPDDVHYPSEKLVRDTFSQYTLGSKGLWAWDAATVYTNAAVVTDNYAVYVSLADDNLGHDPLESDSVWWQKIQGSGSGSGKAVTRLIGNGTDTTFIVSHGLGTRNFVWALRRNDDADAVYTDVRVKAVSLNTCLLSFTTAPAVNEFVFIIAPSGGTSPESGGFTFEQLTPAEIWTINHNLDKVVTVQTFDTSGIQIFGRVQLIDSNTCTITFGAAIAGTGAVR